MCLRARSRKVLMSVRNGLSATGLTPLSATALTPYKLDLGEYRYYSRAEGRARKHRERLICRELGLQFQFSCSGRNTRQLNGNLPNERLDFAGAGVVFTTVEKCCLHLQVCRSRGTNNKRNSNWKLQVFRTS